MYQRLGGEAGLHVIVDDFVHRVMKDMMIGFFFRNVDAARLTLLEHQFASGHLGGPTHYDGRPLRNAHAKHPIMGGQFNRRIKLLENTLRDHQVDEDIIRAWLAHNEELRGHITRDGTFECNGSLPEGPEGSN